MASDGTEEADQGRPDGFRLDPEVVAALEAQLPDVAARTVAAVTREVPAYAEGLSEQIATGISAGVRMALAAFLRLVGDSPDHDPAVALDAATSGAYDLGRAEAREGRTIDALLAAYRVGARTAWHELSDTVVTRGVASASVADFAGLVFAYIDELSAASAAGHGAQLASTARVRARHLHELGHGLLAGEPSDVLLARAERADWQPPETLTAVLLPAPRLHEAAALLDARTLVVTDERTGETMPAGTGVLLVPDAVRTRPGLLRTLGGYGGVVGPVRPWSQASASFARAARARTLALGAAGAPLDTEVMLPDLVLHADPSALEDLREQVLAPLDSLGPATAQRLATTLRSWLLHLGRRGEVAEDLGIHPQTVRYRMTQIRERYGDDLDDPATVQALVLALAGGDPQRASG
jgi:hypothetical protein